MSKSITKGDVQYAELKFLFQSLNTHYRYPEIVNGRNVPELVQAYRQKSNMTDYKIYTALAEENIHPSDICNGDAIIKPAKQQFGAMETNEFSRTYMRDGMPKDPALGVPAMQRMCPVERKVVFAQFAKDGRLAKADQQTLERLNHTISSDQDTHIEPAERALG